MAYLALFIGKLISNILTLMQRGSSLPGKIALNIEENLLSYFKFPEDVIVVTGTNGKTSTTHYIADMAEKNGQTVMTNAAGANLVQGIVTQALNFSSFNFKINADIVVLEVDEATLPRVISDLDPKYLVMLNLFPDQEDRFGSVDDLASLLNGAIIDRHKLVLNANDPRLVWIGEEHESLDKIYYGVGKEDFNQPHHKISCPNCGEELSYDHYHYEHIGYFECVQCGLSTPQLDYMAQNVNIGGQKFEVNGKVYPLPQKTVYTLFNVMAAITVMRDYGVAEATIQNALKETKGVRGRNDTLMLDDKEVSVNLAKNPAGMNQSISILEAEISKPYNLLLAINNNRADGISIEWLNDCVFTRLNNRYLGKIYITGSVRDDLRDILIEQGLPEDKLIIENEVSGLKKLKKSSEKAYIIANYTALNDIYVATNKI